MPETYWSATADIAIDQELDADVDDQTDWTNAFYC